MHADDQRPEGISTPETELRDSCDKLMWMLGPKPESLARTIMEPSLQPGVADTLNQQVISSAII